MATAPKRELYEVPFEWADATAVKAVFMGTADEHQQKRAFQHIVNGVCKIQRLSFVPGPDGDRDTVFFEGRRSVGLELMLYATVPSEDLRKLSDRRKPRR